MRLSLRLLVAGCLSLVLLGTAGCAQQSATARFCDKFDEATHLVQSIDFTSDDPNSIKVYTKAVDDYIAAAESAPPAIRNDVIAVRTDATQTANQVLNADTPTHAQDKLKPVAFSLGLPATKRVTTYMGKHCGFDSTGPSS